MPVSITVVAGLMILLGLVGVAVPLLPGLLLVWGGVAVWARESRTSTGWTVLGVATALVLIGWGVKYLLPGRALKRAGVSLRTTVAGVVLGIVGFFVVPVVGLVLGFVLGVYLAELARRGAHDRAWTATKAALRAIGLGLVIELLTGLVIAATWGITVFVTR